MKTEPTQFSGANGPFDIQCVTMGLHYYFAARWSAQASLAPLCGTLYHHAIEMLLKARLSQSLPPARIKRFGHSLPSLWSTFCSDVAPANLSEFDSTIALLDRFENIRYPDSMVNEGAEILISWTPSEPAPRSGSHPSPPQYTLVVSDLDRLVRRILEVSSKNPHFFPGLHSPRVREVLVDENPAESFWYPAPGL